jgi:hypothetical protein
MVDSSQGRNDTRRQAILQLAAGLEKSLESLTPNREEWGFRNLLNKHKAKFSHFDGLTEARLVRNAIAHDNPVTAAQIQRVEATLDQALTEILPHCSSAIRDRITRSMPRKEQPPPPRPEPVHVKHNLPPQSPPKAEPIQPFAPPFSSGAFQESGSGRIFYMLGAVFFALAIIAYVVNRKQPQAQGPIMERAAVAAATPTATLPESRPSAKKTEPDAGPSAAGDRVQQPSREEQFRALINTNLAISATQPTIALVVVPAGSEAGVSVADALQGFLADPRFQFAANLADVQALRTGGFFDEMYAGNGRFLRDAAQISRVSYILLGKASYSFRQQPDLAADLLTCDLTVTCRLVDHDGTVVHSGSFSAPGPGFGQAQALQHAAERVARQLKDSMFAAIP